MSSKISSRVFYSVILIVLAVVFMIYFDKFESAFVFHQPDGTNAEIPEVIEAEDLKTETDEERPVLRTTLSPTPAPTPQSTMPDPDEPYRKDVLRRLEGFRLEHERKGRLDIFGLRGISWIFTNLNGMMLAAPEFEQTLRQNKILGGVVEVVIRDVSAHSDKCAWKQANLVSIYTRLAGPEVLFSMAEPVVGECKWKAKFEVTIPGEYTLFARLLHFNGKQDLLDECANVPKNNKTYLELIGEIPRYLYYNTQEDCCRHCSRMKECRYSLHSDKVSDVKTWKEGSECLFFKPSTETSPKATRFDLIHQIHNVKEQFPIRYTSSRLPDNPLGTIWQFGCGRDEFLLRWAPCGSFGAPNGSRMRGTEDIILFEHEHRFLVDPRLDKSPWMTLEAAQKEHDAAIGDEKFKPVCDWSKFRLTDFERGRWTKSPPQRWLKCGALTPFVANNQHTCPDYPVVDDPMCMLRFDLQNLNGDQWRFGSDGKDQYLGVWKTELSDNYYMVPGKHNDPFVPGPWVGYFRLHPSSPCRMPPLRSAKQIRECFIDRNIASVHTNGDSIMEFLEHHFNVLFQAAFPNKGEVEFINPSGQPPHFEFRVEGKLAAGGKRIQLANAKVPHILTLYDFPTNKRVAEQDAREIGKSDRDMRIWNTPPFMIWERRQYLTADRTLQAREVISEIFTKHGWYQVDYTILTAPWSMDSTVERDALHIIGHSMIYMAQLYIDAICRADFRKFTSL